VRERRSITRVVPNKRTSATERPLVADLYCGVAGFSLGAHLSGFHTAVALDIDETLTSSIRFNLPNIKLKIADVAEITAPDILRASNVKPGEIAGVIGGPPCQGFSLIGKRDRSDPRNALVSHFFRIVRDLKPRFFIMENVPGLLVGDAKTTLDDAVSSLSGFEIVGPTLLDAWDFGTATRRERVVVLGYNKEYVDAIEEKDIKATHVKIRASVRDAIADLPEPNGSNWLAYRKKDDSKLSEYARRARRLPPKGLGCEAARAKLADNQVSGVKSTNHTRDVVKRFSEVEPGTTDKVSRCPRLDWREPAPTLRAGTGPDKGSYQSIRPIHPRNDRVITVREAARLQGFPDWFQFHDTKWHSFRMIGNSVSPIMAEAMLSALRGSLED
jgi:DNA (cytosine-5)-methyltransferase 1